MRAATNRLAVLEYRVPLETNAQDGPLGREMRGDLFVRTGSGIGIPGCALRVSGCLRGGHARGHLRIRLKNCQAGMSTSFRMLCVRGRFSKAGAAVGSAEKPDSSSLASLSNW